VFLVAIFFVPLYSFDYDLIVIGAGAAGTKAAVLACDLGKRVAIIEKSKIGGGRLWYGDIPFKSLYTFANKIFCMNELASMGLLAADNEIKSNNDEVFSLVSVISNNVYSLFYKKNFLNRGIDVIYGSPKFLDPHTISINEKTLSTDNFLIATGASAYIPEDIEGIHEIDYLIRENFFNLKKLPKSMLIIGGGPLGVELASVMGQYKVDVTLLIKHAVLLPTYDYEMVERVTQNLLKKGVNLVSDMHPTKVEKTATGIRLTAQNRLGKEFHFQAESIFIAAGSKPNTENLDLERAGVLINTKNSSNVLSKYAIVTDDTMRTSAPNIYACGDVTGVHTLSRVAYYQARLAIHNMYAADKNIQKSNYRSMAKVLFAHPEEFASTGLSEQEALKQYGENILIYHYDYNLLERAHIDNTQTGLAKFICDRNGIVLGAHIFGAYAGKIIDMIHAGDDLKRFTREERLKISTSPSYRELFYEISQVCVADVNKLEEQAAQESPSWFQILFTPSLWYKKKNKWIA
jgi:pyruvate/2-oxoglutarate dehydrogenase complex dihydrolipoamide dehydrogenase (E3) component